MVIQDVYRFLWGQEDELRGQQGSQPDFSDFSIGDVKEGKNVEFLRKVSTFGGSEKFLR